MGFYSASQLVQDARRHGVRVLPIDVNHSDWDCTLEGSPQRLQPPRPIPGVRPAALPQPAVRLGLRLVSGLHGDAAKRLLQARAQAPQTCFASTEDLALRAGLERHDLQALAAADALAALSGHRRQQMWDAAAQHRAPALLRHAPVNEAPLELPQARTVRPWGTLCNCKAVSSRQRARRGRSRASGWRRKVRPVEA